MRITMVAMIQNNDRLGWRVCDVAGRVAILVAFAFLIPFQEGRTQEVTAEYRTSIESWQFENEKKLAAPTGWLALIGHTWLQRGENSLGTDSRDAIRLPTDLGAQVRGSFVVDGDRVWLRCDPDSGIRIQGESHTEREVSIDVKKLESDSPDRITIGDRIVIQLVRRNGRFAVRVRDAQSEAIARFQGKRWFPIDQQYCVDAIYRAYEEPKSIRIVNIRGDETTVELVGTVEFQLLGQSVKLDAMLDSPEELFLIFKDRTNGVTTYGPGRFLNAPLPKDGETVQLDFNKTYNPPCAFSPHTLCPLPPKQNHLEIEIQAGEMAPRGY
jgi:uncharacterized protein (DUF1684 family)